MCESVNVYEYVNMCECVSVSMEVCRRWQTELETPAENWGTRKDEHRRTPHTG